MTYWSVDFTTASSGISLLSKDSQLLADIRESNVQFALANCLDRAAHIAANLNALCLIRE